MGNFINVDQLLYVVRVEIYPKNEINYVVRAEIYPKNKIKVSTISTAKKIADPFHFRYVLFLDADHFCVTIPCISLNRFYLDFLLCKSVSIYN